MYGKVGLSAISLMLVGSIPASGQELFNIHEVNSGHPVESLQKINFPNSGQTSLLAAGRGENETKHFSIYPLTAEGGVFSVASLSFTMPNDMLFYDIAKVDDKEKDSLLFMSAQGVSKLNETTGAIELLVPVETIYRQSYNPILEQVDFAKDLNGDGYADILVPDFAGYRLLVSDQKGGFLPEVILNMQVEMRMNGRVPRYSQFPVYQSDVNFDGKDDIIFLKDRSFIAFMQQADGNFSVDSTTINFDLPIIGNSVAEQVLANEKYRDQSNLAASTVKEVKDINGDDIIDIVTVTDVAKGVFNRSQEYKYYYGQNENGTLAFSTDPSSNISLKGFSARNQHIDFTKDGTQDFVAGSVNIGIGKIIGILLSGSTGVDVNFFRQGEDGKYPKKPTFKKKVSVEFNMSSGQSSLPVVELGDIDGDGVKDLILSKNEKEFQFFMGTPTAKKMFARKAIKLKTKIPKNGEDVEVLDLNEDGKDDFIFHFDRLGADGDDVKNRFVVMFAK